MLGNINEIAVKHLLDLKDKTPSLPTGFYQLDDMLKIKPSDYLLVASDTGQFKSTFCTNLFLNCADAGIPSAFYTYEMSDLQVFRRMLASRTELSLDILEDEDETEQHKSKIYREIDKLSSQSIYLYDTGIDTISKVEEDIYAKAELGVKLFVVDYLQLVRADTYTTARWEKISEISRRLRAAALATKGIVVGISQFSRAHKKDRSEPELSDMRDAAIENDATQVLFLKTKAYQRLLRKYKNIYIPPYRESILSIKKNRDGMNDIDVPVMVVPSYFKFVNVDMRDSVQDVNSAHCINGRTCISSQFGIVNNDIVCKQCNTVYTQPCDCDNGLVYYDSTMGNTTYKHIGLCAKCGRGAVILDNIKKSNNLIMENEEKISEEIPFIK